MNLEKYYKRGSLLKHNSSIYKQYVDFVQLNEKNVAESSIDSELPKIAKFLKDFNKPLEELTLDFIIEYKANLSSDNNKNTYIYAFINFFSFIEKEHKLKFPSEELKDLIIRSADIKKENTEEPLNLDEIVKLRNKLKENEDKYYRMIFAFEMVYAYGLSLGELSKCCKENYNYDLNKFKIGNKQLIVNKDIQDFILNYPKSIGKLGKNSYQKYFTEMGLLINRSLEYKDVKATNRIHRIKCPTCPSFYLNESKYWCLVQHKDDISKTKTFICIECAKKMGGIYE